MSFLLNLILHPFQNKKPDPLDCTSDTDCQQKIAVMKQNLKKLEDKQSTFNIQIPSKVELRSCIELVNRNKVYKKGDNFNNLISRLEQSSKKNLSLNICKEILVSNKDFFENLNQHQLDSMFLSKSIDWNKIMKIAGAASLLGIVLSNIDYGTSESTKDDEDEDEDTSNKISHYSIKSRNNNKSLSRKVNQIKHGNSRNNRPVSKKNPRSRVSKEKTVAYRPNLALMNKDLEDYIKKFEKSNSSRKSVKF